MKKSELKETIKSIVKEVDVANNTSNIDGFEAPFGAKIRRGKKKKRKKLNLPAPTFSKVVDGK